MAKQNVDSDFDSSQIGLESLFLCALRVIPSADDFDYDKLFDDTMLKSQLLHPEILGNLARNGHGSKILIADGNFPFDSKSNSAAQHVFLNLSPGVVGCLDVLSAISSAVPIESALVMDPPSSGEFAVRPPEIWSDYESILQSSGNELKLDKVGRFNFYDCCGSSDVRLVVATAEQRIFANLLLTIGVVQ